jgi:glucose-1-phosphate cytidylyltransferase
MTLKDIKLVILAGGLGTRLTEETELKPKPMVEIGGRPILWHIMKHYAHYGVREFFIALGYKGEVIKRYFLDYYHLSGSLSIDMSSGKVQDIDKTCEDWKVNLIDTGIDTNTGGRVKRLEPWLKNGTFMVTYGDGVSNVDLRALLQFHLSQKKMGTVTAVRPPARYGGLVFDGHLVKQFTEKPQIGEGWINGGFLVFEPSIFEHLPGDKASLEVTLMEHLASIHQLAAYKHDSFWQCMDTLRDKRLLESLWAANPPWRIWK